MFDLIEFDTERLHLRQWCSADKDPFASLNADPVVMEYFPSLLDRAASDSMVDRCHARIAERGWGLWAVELKESSEFIGFVGLNPTPTEFPLNPCVEVGWRLAFEYWHHGFASEAAMGALRVGFDQLNLPEIVSFTTLGNLRSRAVMKRIGMRYDDETFEHPSFTLGHPLRTHCVYRLTREQWRAQKITLKNP